MNDRKTALLKPLSAGKLVIEDPIALGPMAGVSDMPFRKLCAENGAGLFYTEMISAKALHFKSKNTEALMKTWDGEKNKARCFAGGSGFMRESNPPQIT